MPPQEGKHLRLHAFLPGSRANGPGLRAVVWVQGCSLGCLGCYNPGTHSARGGRIAALQDLAAQIISLRDPVEGVTISGGEPFQQVQAVAALCQELRQNTSLSVVIFTGFEPHELAGLPHAADVLANCDVLIAGRYQQQHRLARDLRGSANKQLIFLTERYTLADFHALPDAEVIITPEGELWLSGIDPLKLNL